MGCGSSKAETVNILNPTDMLFVNNAFMLVSHNKLTMRPENLIDAWTYLADPGFVQFTVDACFRRSENTPIKVKPFAKYFYIAVKGNIPEKAEYIAERIFNVRSGSLIGVYTSRLIMFIESTVRSYFSILDLLDSNEYQSWVNRGVCIDQTDADAVAAYMTRKIDMNMTVLVEEIEEWLYGHPLFLRMWQEVVVYLFSNLNSAAPPKLPGCKTLPFCSTPGSTAGSSSILSIGRVMFINDCLPPQYRFMWVLLFNSKLHGHSFSQLVSRITHQGPTILIVRDENDYIFGAFAPTTWRVSPKFSGDPTATLFTLEPDINRFTSSGHNKNFQYLNVNQQTMPNGLGMGGQINYWGLWLNQKFGTGSSAVTCSTFYEYMQLSGNSDFEVQHLEVWCVDMSRKSVIFEARESMGPSVLSRGLDRFMIEMVGHQFHNVDQEKRQSRF